MTSGTYEEPLPCGGRLRVTRSSWEIAYYFPGPDMRHKGTFFSVPGGSIEDYITAFKENFEEYLKTKSSIPVGGQFSKPGKMGMTIRIGSFAQGVCITSYHMPLSSPSAIDQVIRSYGYAKERARQAQQLLASLPNMRP